MARIGNWMAQFVAGGLVSMGPNVAANPQAAPSSPESAGSAQDPERFADPLAHRAGVNIAIVAGLLMIPLLTLAGVLSDGELEFGPHIRKTVNTILHIGDSPPARRNG